MLAFRWVGRFLGCYNCPMCYIFDGLEDFLGCYNCPMCYAGFVGGSGAGSVAGSGSGAGSGGGSGAGSDGCKYNILKNLPTQRTYSTSNNYNILKNLLTHRNITHRRIMTSTIFQPIDDLTHRTIITSTIFQPIERLWILYFFDVFL